jgi:transcriptional regulator with XRE-family HTH domain
VNGTHPPSYVAREIFGAALRQARLALGMSQEELAEQASLHRTYIGQVERGERNVSVDNMQLLAEAVGIPIWKLLEPAQ